MAWNPVGNIRGPQGPAGSDANVSVHEAAADPHAQYATDTDLTNGLAGKANTTHTHSGADLTSGTVASARLPLVPNPPVVLTYGTSLTPDASAGNYRVCTLTGNATLNAPSAPSDGQMWRVRFIASGAQRVVTLDAALKLSAGLTSTLTIPSGKRGDVGLLYEAADGWTVLASSAQQ